VLYYQSGIDFLTIYLALNSNVCIAVDQDQNMLRKIQKLSKSYKIKQKIEFITSSFENLKNPLADIIILNPLTRIEGTKICEDNF